MSFDVEEHKLRWWEWAALILVGIIASPFVLLFGLLWGAAVGLKWLGTTLCSGQPRSNNRDIDTHRALRPLEGSAYEIHRIAKSGDPSELELLFPPDGSGWPSVTTQVAALNSRNAEGQSAFHAAVISENLPVLEALTTIGTHVSAPMNGDPSRDAAGHTPAELASIRSDVEAMRILHAAGVASNTDLALTCGPWFNAALSLLISVDVVGSVVSATLYVMDGEHMLGSVMLVFVSLSCMVGLATCLYRVRLTPDNLWSLKEPDCCPSFDVQGSQVRCCAVAGVFPCTAPFLHLVSRAGAAVSLVTFGSTFLQALPQYFLKMYGVLMVQSSDSSDWLQRMSWVISLLSLSFGFVQREKFSWSRPVAFQVLQFVIVVCAYVSYGGAVMVLIAYWPAWVILVYSASTVTFRMLLYYPGAFVRSVFRSRSSAGRLSCVFSLLEMIGVGVYHTLTLGLVPTRHTNVTDTACCPVSVFVLGAVDLLFRLVETVLLAMSRDQFGDRIFTESPDGLAADWLEPKLSTGLYATWIVATCLWAGGQLLLHYWRWSLQHAWSATVLDACKGNRIARDPSPATAWKTNRPASVPLVAPVVSDANSGVQQD